MPGITPVHPIPLEPRPSSRAELWQVLRRIDGWGPGAWREVYQCWRLRHCLLSVDDLEAGVSRDEDDRVAAFVIVVPNHGLGRDAAGRDQVAVCDWVLRQAWSHLLADATITVTTHRPGPEVRATNACLFTEPSPGTEPALLLRLLVRLPLAGMCCDGKALMRFLTRLDRFAEELCRRRRRADLQAHVHGVRRQQAVRAALEQHDLVAFIGDGARLARDGNDLPLDSCKPWRTPRADRITINIGILGQVKGLGIRRGVTAIAGAPYHGKSTVLAALNAGRDDHILGDGREFVVTNQSAVVVQAEDGRRIKRTDLSTFFAKLPGGVSKKFSTERASGATSMAATVLQGVASGSQLLLIDEDSAASNFLSIDPVMRRLLGKSLSGFTTLLDVLPLLANSGVSTVLVAGANHLSLHASDHVVLMSDYQPQMATRLANRLLGRRHMNQQALCLPDRVLHDHPDCLFGPRHFMQVDIEEPERPRVADVVLDLRRAGWVLDRALVRGAIAGAAWCCRLTVGQPTTMRDLSNRWHAFVSEHGPRGLDPFDTALITVPPWPLVVTVLERLSQPHILSDLT